MKYRVSLNDSMDLLVVADSEVEAVRKAKTVKDAMTAHFSDAINFSPDVANAYDKFGATNFSGLRSYMQNKGLSEYYYLFDAKDEAAARRVLSTLPSNVFSVNIVNSGASVSGEPYDKYAVIRLKSVRDSIYGDASPVKDDNYEKALNQLSLTNRKVFEKIVEESEMLSPGDLGVSKYRETMAKLERFGRTLDISLLKEVARALKSVTGGYYKFDDITI